MSQTRTMLALFAALLLGTITTSVISGCRGDNSHLPLASPEMSESTVDATAPEEGKKEDSKKEDSKKEDSKKEDVTKEETKKEESQKAEPKEEATKPLQESKKDEVKAEEPKKEVSKTETTTLSPEKSSPEKSSPEKSSPEKSSPEKSSPEKSSPVKSTLSDEPTSTKSTDPAAATATENKGQENKGQENKGKEVKKEGAVAEVKRTGAVRSAPKVDNTANAKIVAGDWAQWGGSGYRNNTPVAKSIPTQWELGEMDRKTGEWSGSKNVRWVARLGSQTYGNPVIAAGRVYVGTNNTAGYLKRYPSDFDLGVMLCFNEKDGKFQWQDSSEKLPTGRVHDWPLQGICCAPYVEGNKVWYVTSRGEVVCLDAEGFYDDEDDGPVKNTLGRLFDVAQNEDPAKDTLAGFVTSLNEGKVSPEFAKLFAERDITLPGDASVKAVDEGKKWSITAKIDNTERQFQITVVGLAPTQRLSAFKVISIADKDEADRIWVLDMMKELKVSQHNMCSCSIAALGDLLFVNTSNGVDDSHIVIPQANAPSFICIDKNTGKVHWTDHSPGENILHGQWSSPTVAELGGVPQVIFGGGDGWLYSFQADQGKDGKPELLWEFDANPKESKYSVNARSERNHIIGTPVIYDGLVYIAVGEDPEHGEGEGHFWCIDPTMRGDVSAQLAVSVADRTKKLPKRRMQAVIGEQGEVAIDNPNSAVVWHFDKYDTNGDGKFSIDEIMHRTCGTAAIKNDLVFMADFSGLFHCLDAKSGKLNWTYDMLAASWASPLIVGDKVYITDEDGDVAIFNLSPKKHEPLVETNMATSIYTTPVVANETLFIANRTHLFAIEGKDK